MSTEYKLLDTNRVLDFDSWVEEREGIASHGTAYDRARLVYEDALGNYQTSVRAEQIRANAAKEDIRVKRRAMENARAVMEELAPKRRPGRPLKNCR